MRIVMLAVVGVLVPYLGDASEVYKLTNVKKLDSNLYRADGGIVIETNMCLHLTIGEDAILSWDFPGSFSNKIIWDDGESCQVKKIISTR